MNIKLLASLEELLENWADANSGEEWFPSFDWTDDTVPLLAGIIHNALMAIVATNESLKEQYEAMEEEK